MSVDHISPISKGGSNHISNLAITTKEVNIAKNGLTRRNFVELCRDVVLHHSTLKGYSKFFTEDEMHQVQSLNVDDVRDEFDERVDYLLFGDSYPDVDIDHARSAIRILVQKCEE